MTPRDLSTRQLGRSGHRAFAAVLIGLVLAFQAWTIESGLPRPPLFGGVQDDYYNHLARGFRQGHLYLDIAPDPRLVHAENPYDPAHRPPGIGVHDASYYRGHYYLYFGPAPVVAVFLPWRLISGHELPAPYAILMFAWVGFLGSVAFWWQVRRRFFPESGAFPIACCLPVLGLAVMSHAVLRRPDIWELPIASGYAFAMFSLACIPRVIDSRRPAAWVAAASLALGLAVASRPTYLFAAPLLVAPLLILWKRGRLWGPAFSAAAAFGGILVLLLAYNAARFGNPLEFGLNYQLTNEYEAKVRHFSAAFLAFNSYVYYFSPAQWGRYFPFIHPIHPPPLPGGYYGIEYVYGIVPCLPFALLALASPLGLWRRPPGERPLLAALLGAAALLYVGTGGVLLGFVTAAARYMLDFTPALMLLGCFGLLGLDRAFTSGIAAIAARVAGAGLAAYSIFFGLMANVDLHGLFPLFDRPAYLQLTRIFDAPVRAWERVAGFPAGPLAIELRFPEHRGAALEPIVTTGWEYTADFLFVYYTPDGRGLKFGFDHENHGTQWSAPYAVDFASSHILHVEMGSLYPPEGDSFYKGRSRAEIDSIARTLRVTLDGQTAMEMPMDFYPGAPEGLRIGSSEPMGVYGRRFTGQILGVRRLPIRWLEPYSKVYGTIDLHLRFPEGPLNRGWPLVMTGVSGRGDAVHVRLIGSGRLRFGYDHWGFGGLESPPVDFDPGIPHRVEIRYGALLPRARTPAGEVIRQTLQIRLDDALVWERPAEYYDSPATAIRIGRNDLGFSSCDAAFPGEILSEGRSDSHYEPLRSP